MSARVGSTACRLCAHPLAAHIGLSPKPCKAGTITCPCLGYTPSWQFLAALANAGFSVERKVAAAERGDDRERVLA